MSKTAVQKKTNYRSSLRGLRRPFGGGGLGPPKPKPSYVSDNYESEVRVKSKTNIIKKYGLLALLTTNDYATLVGSVCAFLCASQIKPLCSPYYKITQVSFLLFYRPLPFLDSL